ncbi:MAG: nucleotidyltransferase domain-containing protein [Candidatus Nanoarchaeia archaeon]|nr:nucleotidyltransferase domain-containing protein [Candidatus Nanoarchaeia archaeon]
MIKKSIKEKLKEHYLNNPNDKKRVRELERTLKIPLPSVIRYCQELIQEEILTIERIGTVKLFIANKASKEYIFEKKIHNLRKINESKMVEYMKQQLSNPGIILFGSFSKGEDDENSDIDLYIETLSKKKLNLEKFEKIFNKKIQIFQYENLHEVPNKNLANNILNGIIINKNVEVF